MYLLMIPIYLFNSKFNHAVANLNLMKQNTMNSFDNKMPENPMQRKVYLGLLDTIEADLMPVCLHSAALSGMCMMAGFKLNDLYYIIFILILGAGMSFNFGKNPKSRPIGEYTYTAIIFICNTYIVYGTLVLK